MDRPVLNGILDKIDEVFGTLSQPVYLLDREGRCLVPSLPDTFLLPQDLSDNAPVAKNGYLFLSLPGLRSQVLAVRDKPGAKDLLLLSTGLVKAVQAAHGVTDDLNNALKRLLSDELSGQELDAMMEDYGIKDVLPRCAVLISLDSLRGLNAKDALADVLPMTDSDLLIGLDSRQALLVRDMTGENAEDIMDYTMALQDTLQNELGIQAHIGVSETVATLRELAHAYRQARQAAEIGRTFRSAGQIYEYRSLVLERFLSEIPGETARRYASLLFNTGTARLFNDEMLETVDVFISKDLNLTDSARELYIHRNTLVYRLDKLHRLSGLDLRHFRDAMTFKLLSDLKKREKAGALQYDKGE